MAQVNGGSPFRLQVRKGHVLRDVGFVVALMVAVAAFIQAIR